MLYSQPFFLLSYHVLNIVVFLGGLQGIRHFGCGLGNLEDLPLPYFFTLILFLPWRLKNIIIISMRQVVIVY